MATPKPSDLELQILSVLWEEGPATARHVLGAMPDGKDRAYTTILSVMQQMEKKGLLVRERNGQAHIYRPAVQRESILRPLMSQLLRLTFGGDAKAALHYLIDEAETAGDAELAAVRKLIDEQRAQESREDAP